MYSLSQALLNSYQEKIVKNKTCVDTITTTGFVLLQVKACIDEYSSKTLY